MALTLLGIILAVAVVVAVDLANSSARRSLALSMEMLYGNATHRISAGATGIPEALYVRLRKELLIRDSSPLIFAEIELGGKTLTLLGLDPFAAALARPAQSRFSDMPERTLFLEAGAAMLSGKMAEELGLKVGDQPAINYRGQAKNIRIVGLFETPHPAAGALLLTDIAVAQELLGRLGSIDSIELALNSQRQAEKIARWLPDGYYLNHLVEGVDARLELTRAFHANLTAMSLLALLVGGFLIYNSVAFNVLRRHQQLGILRALGVTRREIYGFILGEALLLGLIATLLGMVLGIVLAQYLVVLVTRTIDDLYYTLQVRELSLSPVSLVKGLLLGLVTTLLAAALPAIKAAQTAPVLLLQHVSGVQSAFGGRFKWLLIGFSLMGVGLLLARYVGVGLTAGFIGLAMVIAGFSLLIPSLVQWLNSWVQRFSGFSGPLFMLVFASLRTSLHRTTLAIAALTVAVAMTIGVGVMTDSFRFTFAQWLEQSFNSEMYVSASGRSSDRASPALPASLVTQLKMHPMVAMVWESRAVRLDTELGLTRVMAISHHSDHGRGFNLKQGDTEQVRRAFAAGEGILISEPLAWRFKLQLNDRVVFHTDSGELKLPILGIFYDYTSGSGLILMPQQLYRERWQDDSLTAVGLFRKKGVAAEAFSAQIRQMTEAYGGQIRVRSDAELRAMSLQIFDRTFAITQVLRLLATGVAFIGILSALLALQVEKRSEYALMRSLGATPGEMALMIFIQTGSIGLIAGVLAIPLGLLMSELLVNVINLRSFGWSMQYVVAPVLLGQALLLALIAALLAAIYPAWRSSQSNVASALRDE